MSTEAKFKKLLGIVANLRGPNGCPWDKEQTQKTLTQFVLEEAYELVEAIESGHQQDICEELGDYLFQVILQAQVAQDEKHFSIDDVLNGISEKLIKRHPHVFSQINLHQKTNAKAENSITAEEVWNNWHKQKAEESKTKSKPIFSYPKNLPALQAAQKIGLRTEGFKFDWETPQQVMEKVYEELRELEEALAAEQKPHSQQSHPQNRSQKINTKKQIEHEIGDLLFSISQLARHLDIEPEATLRSANRRFERRFLKVLELSKKSREEFAMMTTEEKEALWNQAKLFCRTDEQ